MIVFGRSARAIRFVRLLPQLLVAAIALEIALRRRPVDRVLAEMFHVGQRRLFSPEIPPATIGRAIRAVYRVLPFERTCLKHALIFGRVRRAQGLPAELCIGVQKSDGVFGAHAWIEDGFGNVLTDPLDGFTPMPLPRESFRDQQATD